LNPNGDDTHNWSVNVGGAGYAALDDWDSGSPAFLSDFIFGTTTGVGIEITDFENPVYGGVCTSIDLKIAYIIQSPFPTFGIALFDGAVQIGSEFTTNTDTVGWKEITLNWVVAKTAAELSDLKVRWRYISGSGLIAVAAAQIDIKFSSFSSSSSSSESFSSSCSSCDSAFSSSSSSSSQSLSSSSSCVAGWVQHYKNDSTGWGCSVNCSSSPPWTVAGPGMKISEQGSWNLGYRPIKIRITGVHNLGGAANWDFALVDTLSNVIASISVPPAPGGVSAEVDIDWSNNQNIDEIHDLDAPGSGTITNIEFLECGGSESSSCSSSFSSSSSSSFSSSSSSSSCDSAFSSSSSSSSSSQSSASSSSGAGDYFAVPDGDVSTGMTTFGSGTGHYGRINSGIFSGTPDDTNGVEGEQGETDRWTFDQPSFNGVTAAIVLRARLKSTSSDGITFTLYSDGVNPDGSKTWYPDDFIFHTFTELFVVTKTAANLGNIEVRAVAQGAGGGIHDEVSEVELQFMYVASLSSSSSSNSI